MRSTKLAFEFGNWSARISLMAAMLVLSPGCTLKVKSIDIISTANVNQNTAVAVDVVFLLDEELVETLPEVTARNWFAQKPQYLLRYPQSFVVDPYELTPASSVNVRPKTLKNPSPRNAKAVLLFANYLTEDMAYTLDISNFRNPIVTLHEKTISVRERGDVVK
jgi:type VI secretion system protein